VPAARAHCEAYRFAVCPRRRHPAKSRRRRHLAVTASARFFSPCAYIYTRRIGLPCARHLAHGEQGLCRPRGCRRGFAIGHRRRSLRRVPPSAKSSPCAKVAGHHWRRLPCSSEKGRREGRARVAGEPSVAVFDTAKSTESRPIEIDGSDRGGPGDAAGWAASSCCASSCWAAQRQARLRAAAGQASWAVRRKGREPNLQYGLQSTAKKFYDFLFDDFDCNLFSIQFCTNVYIV